ncbi:MAG: MFS transporter [Blastocatellia bacterium]|nr:MFS transporter [Blastocatellia bacterium]
MSTTAVKPSKLPLILIFLVVLVDVTSWGMVIPILPTYAQRFNADALTVGLLLGTYSLTQFFFAPILGRWSDRIGRRPALFISMLGTVLACTLTGLASSMAGIGLMILFLARALDGITGGNISIAQSYVADVTTPETRSHGMGIIGAAIGLGYTFGPAFSGIVAKHFGIAMPFFVAAAVAFCNALAVFLFLPETLSKEKRNQPKVRTRRFAALGRALQTPQISGLLVVCLVFTFGAMLFMAMIPLLTEQHLHFNAENNAYYFAFLGLVTTLVQGGLVRVLVKRMSEMPVLVAGLIVMGGSMAAIPFAVTTGALYLFGGGWALGTALVQPTMLGLISRRSPATEQGATIGLTASMGSLGRIIGPPWGGFAFKHLGTGAPFYSGTTACLVALGIVVLLVPFGQEKFDSKEEIVVP